ncbi:hypothetical protein J0H33_08650 [bacterium]|jgi:hypothetical protein|nr:hypothetical protein [bacterium]
MSERQTMMPSRSGYAWSQVGDRVRCYRANADSQFVTKDLLLESRDHTSFHDHRLAHLTMAVNELFAEAERHAPEGMDLAMLKTPDGFFLAWTENHHDEDFPQHLKADGVDADSPAEKVREALHLKV